MYQYRPGHQALIRIFTHGFSYCCRSELAMCTLWPIWVEPAEAPASDHNRTPAQPLTNTPCCGGKSPQQMLIAAVLKAAPGMMDVVPRGGTALPGELVALLSSSSYLTVVSLVGPKSLMTTLYRVGDLPGTITSRPLPVSMADLGASREMT